MKLLSYPAAAVALLILSACATDSSVDPSAADAPQLARREPQTMTGSRIPASRTEKMVGAVGGKDYQENENAHRSPLITN